METSNAFNAFRVSDVGQVGNVLLVISCAQSLGVQLTSYDLARAHKFVVGLNRCVGVHRNTCSDAAGMLKAVQRQHADHSLIG